MISLLITALSLIMPAVGAAPEGEVTLPIDLARYAVRGRDDAPVLLAEFSDFKCHACEKFNLTIMPNLEKEFIEHGRLQVVFVDFPLVDEAHYTTVAESVHCAGLQGKYWQMHDLLWQSIGALSDRHLAGYAAQIGLDVPSFSGCLETDRFRQRVLDDLAFTYGLGLSSRPTFFVGRRVDGGKGPPVWRGRYIVGAQNYVVYKSVIQRMVAGAGS